MSLLNHSLNKNRIDGIVGGKSKEISIMNGETIGIELLAYNSELIYWIHAYLVFKIIIIIFIKYEKYQK